MLMIARYRRPPSHVEQRAKRINEKRARHVDRDDCRDQKRDRPVGARRRQAHADIEENLGGVGRLRALNCTHKAFGEKRDRLKEFF